MEPNNVLRTPFEFVRAGGDFYVMTRKSLEMLIADDVPTSSDGDLKCHVNSVLAEKILKKKSRLQARVIVARASRRVLQLVENVFAAKVTEIFPDRDYFVLGDAGTSVDGADKKLLLNVVVDCSGTEPALCRELRNFPLIYYFFDLKNRYRTSVYWPCSGRPCPRCVARLYISRVSDERRKLLLASRLLSDQHPASRVEGVSLPSLVEILSCIESAVKLACRIDQNDSYMIDELRYTECLDLTADNRKYDVLPVDPACSHEGFVK